MLFQQTIKHYPKCYDPRVIADLEPQLHAVPPKVAKLLLNCAGSSLYLHQLIKRHLNWLLPRITLPAEEAIKQAYKIDNNLAKDLRIAKGRIALILALCDLSHIHPLEWITHQLSDFADFAVQAALNHELRGLAEKGKLDAQRLNDNLCAGVFVLAMGKMGAHELNYSSDIDLIFMFDDTQYPIDERHDYRRLFVGVTQRIVALLSKNSADGYVFRVDLRLRPNPSATVVCPAMSTSETYYIKEGRTWERAAFIKARVCAGNHIVGNNFLKRLQKFIWRRHLDFVAIDEIENILSQARSYKGIENQITLRGHNIKMGRGGIREIEFFTQSHQLIYGGRHANLRHITTLGALKSLALQGRITNETAHDLSVAYRHHRMIEHRIQMLRDAQTHSIPTNNEEIERLIALCGYETEKTFANHTIDHLRKTHQITTTKTNHSHHPLAPTKKQRAYLENCKTLPAFRNFRAVESFEKQINAIWALSQHAPNPEQALVHFEYFLSRLTSGVQLFSLFARNPQVLKQVFHVVNLSKHLGETLARNVHILDGITDTGITPHNQTTQFYETAFNNRLTGEEDFESTLIELRAFKSEEHFKIVYAQIARLIPTSQAEAAYTNLAEVCLRICLQQAQSDIIRRYGTIKEGQVAVLAMGKLGSREMTCTSDLDIIVIYNGDRQAYSSKKNIDIRSYYQKLTRLLLTTLTSSMNYGRLYEVDMRLRPSGRAGTVATSVDAFENYQREKAWVWEHLALTRARIIAGDSDLSKQIEKIYNHVIRTGFQPERIKAEVSDMRMRLAALSAQKPDRLSVKKPLGGILDIELFTQMTVLLSPNHNRTPLDQLKAAINSNQIPPAQGYQLQNSYEEFTLIEHLKRLIGSKEFKSTDLSDAAVELILSASSQVSIPLLEQHTAHHLNRNKKILDQLLQQPTIS